MKFMILAALAALTISAQTAPTAAPEPKNVKTEVAKATPPAKPDALPQELLFNETQTLKIQLAQTQMALLNKKYNIENYNKEAQPLVVEEQNIYLAACKQLGIPETLITTQCGVEPGVDGDGKAKLDPAGKPVPAKVWWQHPTTAPASGTVGAK